MASRYDVDQKDIARTVLDLAIYLYALNIGAEVNRLCESWMVDGGLADRIKGMSQEELDEMFAQEGRDGDFRQRLLDFRRVLEFWGYRDQLDDKASVAYGLLDRIDAFNRGEAEYEMVQTACDREVDHCLDSQPRHASERSEPIVEAYCDVGRSVHAAYNKLSGLWMPVEGGVEAWFFVPGSFRHKAQRLGSRMATIRDGLRRGGIEADLRVQLGETYGEDAVVVRMSGAEYRKYMDIKAGGRTPDLRKVGWEPEMDGPPVLDDLASYHPDRAAFFGPDRTLYVPQEMAQHAFDYYGINEKIAWMRRTRAVEEGAVSLPHEDGARAYVRFRPLLNWDDRRELVVADGRYWESDDLARDIHRQLWLILDVLNENDPSRHAGLEYDADSLGDAWRLVKGEVWVPMNAAFEQAVLHFRYKYGQQVWRSHICEDHPDARPGEAKSLWWSRVQISGDNAQRIREEFCEALKQIEGDIQAGGTGLGLAVVAPPAL